MLKRILKRAGIGFLLGALIGNLITAVIGLGDPGAFLPVSQKLLMKAGSLPCALLLQSLFSGLYGAVCFAGAVLYDVEELPLAAASALHCAIVIVFYFPVAILLGWVSRIEEILLMTGVLLVCYFLTWLIMNAIYKAQVKKLNELQSGLKSMRENRKDGEG